LKTFLLGFYQWISQAPNRKEGQETAQNNMKTCIHIKKKEKKTIYIFCYLFMIVQLLLSEKPSQLVKRESCKDNINNFCSAASFNSLYLPKWELGW